MKSSDIQAAQTDWNSEHMELLPFEEHYRRSRIEECFSRWAIARQILDVGCADGWLRADVAVRPGPGGYAVRRRVV
jgi:hypothetical protein